MVEKTDGGALKQAVVELRRLRAEVARLEAVVSEPIAVVGIGCRIPGGANSPAEFWSLLEAEADTIVETPADRWNVDELYDPDPKTPGHMATRWGGFLDDIGSFDPAFFGISPREAEAMDPQQRLVLECSWEALEHGAIRADHLMESRTGVMVGVSTNDYAALQIRHGELDDLDVYFTTGSVSNSVVSGRVSYALGLQGPAVSVDTACSSSLVALHLACQALRQGDADLMLAGGVNVITSPENSIGLSRAQMMAPDGRCKPFDASADGFVRAEGCGMVVLKRLSDAERDGNRILATVVGSAVNQDGRSAGITAPNGPSQVRVVRAALEKANIASHEVGFVETHGTGTALGDPIEFEALATSLGSDRSAPLLIGSVKSNLGHLETAAGAAGFIKLVLAAHHGKIPATIHHHEPSPHIRWEGSGIEVATELRDWPAIDGRRVGGVSSFGFSGTNVHMLVEGYEQPAAASADATIHRPTELHLLSARTPVELRAVAAAHAEAIRGRTDTPKELAAITHTARSGRSVHAERAAVTANSTSQLATRLQRIADGAAPPSAVFGSVMPTDRPKVGFLFTGQGSQSFGMARELYEAEPIVRSTFDECAAVLKGRLPRGLLDELFDETRVGEPLVEPTFAQPALFALQVALTRLWSSWGIDPWVVHGHSLGEYSAAWAAGVIGLEDGIRLTAERGRLIDTLPHDGRMAVVFARPDIVEAGIADDDRVEVASYNGPETTVISGLEPAVVAAVGRFEAAGVRTRSLEISFASHNQFIEPVLPEFKAAAAAVAHTAPVIPLVTNRTGSLVEGAPASDSWADHLRSPVRFEQGMYAMRDAGCDAYLEIGPAPVLSSVGAGVLGETPTWMTSLRRGSSDWDSLFTAAGTLFALGAPLNGGALGQPGTPVVDLPTYPFTRRRYWMASLDEARGGSAMSSVDSLADEASEPVVESVSTAVAAIRAAAEFDRVDLLGALVAEHVVHVLKLDDLSEIDTRAGLMDSGLDSLMAVELRSALGEDLELVEPLPATLVMDHPTIAAIVTLLHSILFDTNESTSPPPASIRVPTTLGQSAIDAIDDSEIEAALMDRLRLLEGGE